MPAHRLHCIVPASSLLQWIEARLDKETAELANGHDAVCLFVNDSCDAEVSCWCQNNGAGMPGMGGRHRSYGSTGCAVDRWPRQQSGR